MTTLFPLKVTKDDGEMIQPWRNFADMIGAHPSLSKRFVGSTPVRILKICCSDNILLAIKLTPTLGIGMILFGLNHRKK
jgi:hypothetical protein